MRSRSSSLSSRSRRCRSWSANSCPSASPCCSRNKIAATVAGPLQILVLIARPLVWFLETSTALLLKLLRIPEKKNESVTEEEVKIAIAEGTEAGVIDEVEEKMIHGVLALADNSSSPRVMVPRPDVYWIDLADKQETIEREIADCPYSRIVVARDGDLGRPLGVVQKKDLVGDLISGRGNPCRGAADPAAHSCRRPCRSAAAGNLQGLTRPHRVHCRRIWRLPRHRDAERRAGRYRRRPRRRARAAVGKRRAAAGRVMAGGWTRGRIRSDRKAEAAGYPTANSTPRRALRSNGWRIFRSSARPSKFPAGASKFSIWTASGSTSFCSRRCRKPQTDNGNSSAPRPLCPVGLHGRDNGE